MKFRQLGLILIILIAISFAIGCSSEQTAVSISIMSDKENYSPTMSSVPGLPLNVTIRSSVELSNLEYFWKADKGSFIKWSEETGYVIQNLGQECTIKESSIYWAPVTGSNPGSESIHVTVEVRQSGSEKIIGQKSVVIKITKDSVYSIQK